LSAPDAESVPNNNAHEGDVLLENKAQEVKKELQKLVPDAEVEISETTDKEEYVYLIISADYVIEDEVSVILGYAKEDESFFVGLDDGYNSDEDEQSILFIYVKDEVVVPLAVRFLVGE
jgi:hypothetical protein